MHAPEDSLSFAYLDINLGRADERPGVVSSQGGTTESSVPFLDAYLKVVEWDWSEAAKQRFFVVELPGVGDPPDRDFRVFVCAAPGRTDRCELVLFHDAWVAVMEFWISWIPV